MMLANRETAREIYFKYQAQKSQWKSRKIKTVERAKGILKSF
ncbi:hypothetical protein [Methanococcoides alaskense]|uniref:Uncharacterized protein n=1 Tax=Methanococcoides alaskense TaxID=325778 RepID=A0AA90TY38_9EURY|nr:hypothetical protein [Methanococcoides alaskense]MDA0524570.1 hypothetical protein [Methanococcoides alaskense]MDR6222258.1 hypothetical protein [Methanococcoides alaskense]